jgi:DNA-binding NtrC family response regulator
VVLISGHGNIESAVRAIKMGAFDFVEKPLSLEKTVLVVRNALHQRRLEAENRALRAKVDRHQIMVGESYAMRQLREQVAMAAPTNGRVLIYGENGTGKELVARTVHALSRRRAAAFVEVNCAAIPEELIESELFGHVRGASTGAVADRRGKFEVADGGTIFLDEIGDMPLTVQAKILRVLQERSFEPVGSGRSERTDTRVIAATHRDLRQVVEQSGFREDLFYRLNVFPIALPALRERKEDIPALAQHFLKASTDTIGKRVVGVTPAALAAMTNYHWPGNIRELQNCVERAVIVARGSTIDIPDLPRDLFEQGAKPVKPARARPGNLDEELERLEKSFILEALRETNGVQSKAARLLGINERSLWHRVKKLGIAITKRASSG